MKEIEDSISVLVQNHFPEFYKEEGDTFVAFVKAYYEWAQQTNNHVYFARNLLEYRDIDKTIDDFLVHFKEKYLVEAPVSYDTTRQNIKNSLDFYRSKGTKRGTELFFKEVLNSSEVDVYFPGKDVLYASDGEWFVPVYLEVSLSDKTKTFVGKQITGSFSGATAFVESVGRKAVGGKFFDVVFISNVRGSFQYEEVITSDDLTFYTTGVATADAAVPEAVATAKGDILVASASAVVDNLAVGTNDHVLTADSTQTLGVKWAAIPAPTADASTATVLMLMGA